MAHTKAAGAAKRTVNIIGKRLGLKKFGGEYVKAGNIIIRQRGTLFYPGENTKLGRDHTIFATANGFVGFRHMTGYKRAKKYIDVLPQPAVEVAASAEVAEVKPVAKKAVAAKKPAAKAKTTTAPKTAKKKSAAEK